VARLRRLAEVFLPFLSLQALSQVAAALAGVLVVRRLPIAEFAIYAIATSVQGSLAVLSDIGVTTLLLARAGQFHSDRPRLAELTRTARAFRLRLLLWTLGLAAPLLWFALGESRPDPLHWALILVVLAGIVAVQVSSSLDGTMLLALLQAEKQQAGQLFASLSRVAGFGLLLSSFPTYLTALCINFIGGCIPAVLYRRALTKTLPETTNTNPDDLRSFRTFSRTQFINAAYFAFSAQVTIWLVGLMGTSRVVAQVGALGRLSNIIVLAQSALLGIIAPRMARYRDSHAFRVRYLQVVGGAVAISILLTLSSVWLPGPLLWVIGPKYAGLASMLPIAVASACTFTISITIFSLNSAKGWFDHNWVAVPLTIIAQIVSLKIMDVSRLPDALLFGWITVTPPLLINAVISWVRLRRWSMAGTP
jgi:O-antigen/teichoic acid export membrane protein